MRTGGYGYAQISGITALMVDHINDKVLTEKKFYTPKSLPSNVKKTTSAQAWMVQDTKHCAHSMSLKGQRPVQNDTHFLAGQLRQYKEQKYVRGTVLYPLQKTTMGRW